LKITKNSVSAVIARAAVVTLLSIALAVPTVSAAGGAKVKCVTEGTTSISGPVPRDATLVLITWTNTSGGVPAIVQWTGGKKRWPTPLDAASVEVAFHTFSGSDDLLITAICQA
jgi:hypothetical protein